MNGGVLQKVYTKILGNGDCVVSSVKEGRRVLIQEFEDSLRPVWFRGRVLSEAELRYCATDK